MPAVCSTVARLISEISPVTRWTWRTVSAIVPPASSTRRVPIWTVSALATISCLISRAASAERCASPANLGGDHCETASLLAGPGRLDCCVECQDVGLEGNPVDQAGDVGDAPARGRDLRHGRDDAPDRLAATPGDLCRPSRRVRWPGRAVSALFRTVAVICSIDATVCLQRTRLLLASGRQVVVSAGDLGRGRRDAVGHDADLRHHGRQPIVHPLERSEQMPRFVATVDDDRGPQVAGGDPPPRAARRDSRAWSVHVRTTTPCPAPR